VNTRTPALLVFSATLAVSLPVLAAGDGGDHGPTTSELIWQAVNLALLVGVLFAVARKPIQKYFAERRDQIRGDIDDASDFLKASEARYAEWQGKLVDLESALEQIRATSRRRAEEEGARILAEARAAADRIKRDAGAAVEQELRRAKDDLRDEAADLAVELAANLLRDRVGDPDRERLLDEFISNVETTRN
jgi:F-type H+-transporting ATPase subunit b